MDTTFLLDLAGRGGHARGDRAGALLKTLSDAGDDLVTTRLNVAELWVGVERSNDSAAERARVDTLLTDIEILELDATAARIFGVLVARLMALGRPIGDMDALIASIALVNNHSLITRDAKHFRDIPDLDVISY